MTITLDAQQAGGTTGGSTTRARSPGLMQRIFDYGVSGAEADGGPAPADRRGQGLFVARTYMGKMGGTIEARNEAGGVSFVLTLQRAAGARRANWTAA